MGSDPRLYVVMVHVECFLRGIDIKMAPMEYHMKSSGISYGTSYGKSYGLLWNILSNPVEYPREYPMEYPMEYPVESNGISKEIL
jgi:hypothetical protein